MPDLTVSYQYTREDIMNFVLDTFSFEKVRCTLFLIFNLASFIIGVVFFCIHNIPLGCLFVAFSIMVFPLILFLTYITVRNSLRVLSSVVCTLKDDGVNFISNFGDTLIPFKDINDVKVTEALIFIYISKNSALVVPKRAFRDSTKAIDFAARLVDRFNKSKTKVN